MLWMISGKPWQNYLGHWYPGAALSQFFSGLDAYNSGTVGKVTKIMV